MGVGLHFSDFRGHVLLRDRQTLHREEVGWKSTLAWLSEEGCRLRP